MTGRCSSNSNHGHRAAFLHVEAAPAAHRLMRPRPVGCDFIFLEVDGCKRLTHSNIMGTLRCEIRCGPTRSRCDMRDTSP